MLELVRQSLNHRGSGDSRTGAHDLIREFQLQPFYILSMKNIDKNYISISSKEVPTGLPGDTSLFANPAWSLLRPPPIPPPPTESLDRITERVRRYIRFPPGGAVLSTGDKGLDVTRNFLKNVSTPTTRPPAASSGPGNSAGAGSGSWAAASGKRRTGSATAGTVTAEASGGSEQQYSGDTSFSHESSKRQRSHY